METGFRIGAIAGIPLFVRPSLLVFNFLALFLLPLWLMRQGFEPATAIASALIFQLLVLLGIVVHELGHAITAKFLGYRVKKIFLTWWGGATSVARGEYWRSILISVAGPAVNGVYALLVGALYALWGSSPMGYGLFLAFWVNIFLSVFNLLPIAPMDGWHVVQDFFSKVSGRRSTGIRVAAWLSLGCIPLGLLFFLVYADVRDPINILLVVVLSWTVAASSLPWIRHLGSAQETHFAARSLVYFCPLVPGSSTVSELQIQFGQTYDYMMVATPDDTIKVLPAFSVMRQDSANSSPVSLVSVNIPSARIGLNWTATDLMECVDGDLADRAYRELGAQPLAWVVADSKNQPCGLIFRGDLERIRKRA